MGENKYPYIPPEVIDEMKKVDLLSYLERANPGILVDKGRGYYELDGHDSFKIDHGKWHWWSANKGGSNALSYLKQVEEMPWQEAILELERTMTGYDRMRDVQYKPVQPTKSFKRSAPKEMPKDVFLPRHAKDNETAKAYLMSRGIDPEIIDECIQKGLIYETKYYPKRINQQTGKEFRDTRNYFTNVVFVGYNENGKPAWANWRATSKDAKINKANYPGSKKEYAFRMVGNPANPNVHFFESAIDLLSYATLLKQHGFDWHNYNMASCDGVFIGSPEHPKLPLAMKKYFKDYPVIPPKNSQEPFRNRAVYLHFDRDEVGREATKAIIAKFEKDNNYRVVDNTVKLKELPGMNQFKDINEYLQEVIRLKQLDKSMDANVRDWYQKEFPTDELGGRIRADLTFQTLDNKLGKEDVYATLSVGDSTIRERIFQKLAELKNVSYDAIYQQWMLEEQQREVQRETLQQQEMQQAQQEKQAEETKAQEQNADHPEQTPNQLEREVAPIPAPEQVQNQERSDEKSKQKDADYQLYMDGVLIGSTATFVAAMELQKEKEKQLGPELEGKTFTTFFKDTDRLKNLDSYVKDQNMHEKFVFPDEPGHEKICTLQIGNDNLDVICDTKAGMFYRAQPDGSLQDLTRNQSNDLKVLLSGADKIVAENGDKLLTKVGKNGKVNDAVIVNKNGHVYGNPKLFEQKTAKKNINIYDPKYFQKGPKVGAGPAKVQTKSVNFSQDVGVK